MKDQLIPIIRILLYAVAGRLSAGGWLPADIAAMLPAPEIVEIVAGFVMGAITFVWYWMSNARAVLKDARQLALVAWQAEYDAKLAAGDYETLRAEALKENPRRNFKTQPIPSAPSGPPPPKSTR